MENCGILYPLLSDGIFDKKKMPADELALDITNRRKLEGRSAGHFN